ncbi:hypothetical protein [Streptomyces sp. NPDC096351]|uniref:hypothetical protein n=1 Tax=Streptomyces sp. NPDC096351 TaxID=3366087 RepID=UPI0038168178
MPARETMLADLVQGRAQQFRVPLYQRTYSWTEKQFGQSSPGSSRRRLHRLPARP